MYRIAEKHDEVKEKKLSISETSINDFTIVKKIGKPSIKE